MARTGIIHGSGHFESGDKVGFYWTGNEPEIVTNIVRAGTYACKCFVDADSQGNNYRTSVTMCVNDTDPEGTQNALTMTIGNKYWIGFSIYTSADWVGQKPGNGLDDVLLNIQAAPDAGEAYRMPVLAISTVTEAGPANQWKLRNRYDYGEYTPGFDGGHTVYVDFDNVIGYWTDFVVEVEWNATDDDNGMVKIWINDTLEASWTGPNCSNDVNGPFFTLGSYIWYFHSGDYDQWINQRTRCYYLDELRLGDHTSSYNDVKPGPPAGGVTSGVIMMIL